VRQPKVDFKSQKHPAELDEALQRGDGDPPQTVMSWVPLGRAKNKPLTCARDSGRYSLLILVHLRSASAGQIFAAERLSVLRSSSAKHGWGFFSFLFDKRTTGVFLPPSLPRPQGISKWLYN